MGFLWVAMGCSDPMEKAVSAEKAGDYDAAVTWYQKAAEQGNLRAQTNLGLLYIKGRGPGASQDYAGAFKWLQKPAEQGDARAQGGLGYIYKIGAYNVPQNYAEALKWLSKGADQGDTFAQIHLGDMYYQGEGVAKDLEQAAHYIEKAATAGNVDAMRRYGMMYQEGTGVAQDNVEALHWFLTAVAHGNDISRANANVLQARMTADQIQEAQRRAAAANTETALAQAPANGSGPGVIGVEQAFRSPTLDNHAGAGVGRAEISAIAFAGDKILIGGDFDAVNGHKTAGLARLDPNGSLDPMFQQKLPAGIQSVRGITVQSDGKILVVNQLATLLRLNADGSQDTTFWPFVNPGNIWNVRLQPSGKILYLNTSTEESYIARLDGNATPDASFKRIGRLTGSSQATQSGGILSAFEVQRDGRIVAVGQFDQVDGVPSKSVVRLNEDGSVDLSFRPADLNALPGVKMITGYPVSVQGVAIQATGKILLRLGIGFDSGHGLRQIIRLNSDGSYDPSFRGVDVVNAHGTESPSGWLTDVDASEPNALYAAGVFGRINDTDVPFGFAKLNANGNLDATFQYAGIDLNFNDTANFLAVTPNQHVFLVYHRKDSSSGLHCTVIRLL